MSSVKVTLGGVDYDVPKMNIGQLEEVTVAFDLPPARRPFAILKIAMKRAQPAIPDFGAIEASNDEIAMAVRAILFNSGFEGAKKETSAPNPDAPKDGAEA
jgi:hypothetical protein